MLPAIQQQDAHSQARLHASTTSPDTVNVTSTEQAILESQIGKNFNINSKYTKKAKRGYNS